MCLSNVYRIDGDKKELVFKNAADVSIGDNSIVFRDIMGRSEEIEGKLDHIDLMDNFIYIK